MQINDTTDVALVAAARRAERLAALKEEQPNSDLIARLPLEPVTGPALFSEATYQLDADHRAAAAIALAKQAADVGMLSAGYIEVAAVGIGIFDTTGRVRYFPYTQARYSVTVRDPQGTASGWAGMDWYDWKKIDAATITAQALDKCLRSKNPVAIEPGRYTAILEPQAVSDLIGQLFHWTWNPEASTFDKVWNEDYLEPIKGPFLRWPKNLANPTKLGDKIADERVTISADPMDPELGVPPFWSNWPYRITPDPFVIDVYHPATWIERGVLTNLCYRRNYGIEFMKKNTGLPNSGAFRMSGGPTSVDEMIATTKRGVLVTRFDQIVILDPTSQLYRGYTRDGFWLIENGKISKPVKNMVFTESPLFVLNNIDDLGPPQRTFHPQDALDWSNPQPAIAPPLKVRDFSFTALADAV